MAKIYTALLRNHIEPKVEDLGRTKMAFREIDPWHHQILVGVCAKNLKATILFVNFAKAFDSIHRRKMEQILLAHGLSKETITAIDAI